MKFRKTLQSVLRAACLVGCACGAPYRMMDAEGDAGSRFRGVLDLAGLGPEVLAQFTEGPDYRVEDWQLLIQLLHRMRQYPTTQQDDWALAWSKQPEPMTGDLLDIVGTVETVETLMPPKKIVRPHELASLYRCRFRFRDFEVGGSKTVGIVLSPKIPRRWQANDAIDEPIRFRGVLLRTSSNESQPAAVFFTEQLAWYPNQGVPTGQLLLARHGMDVALLDEVMHRRPFVRPEVSREGEAFYACLAAMKHTDAGELSSLAKQNVAQVAEKWREAKRVDHPDDEVARQQQAIAAAVSERSELGLSSVAPLFLQPEKEVGELVRIEGTARRAVRIAAPDQQKIESYYELEIFPPDSQNLPVVCCVNDLPPGFPTGDAIREPVRVEGVFFKSWLYRSRDVQQAQGETGRQQRLYTPIVVGGAPTWLNRAAKPGSHWGLWGGIAFLVVLIIVSLNMARMARKDRRSRTAQRKFDVTDLQ